MTTRADPQYGQRSASGADGPAIPALARACLPSGVIRSVVHGIRNVGSTRTGTPNRREPVGDRGLDEPSAGQPTKVGRSSTEIAPPASSTDTAPTIPRSTTETIGSSGSMTSASAARTAAASTARRRCRRRSTPAPDPGDPDLGAGLAHQVAPGSARRTEVNSPHSQAKASP